MNPKPTYQDIISVMAKASIGDATARVAVPECPDDDDEAAALAVALNMLLDDLDLRHQELQRSYLEIKAQQEAIRRLWTPILTVADRVLLLPLVGWIDAERAKQIQEVVLQRIHVARARVVIIDLTAVPEIDSHAAGALGRLASAARLLGAELVIAGISTAVAQAMTVAGLDLRDMRTEADMVQAIRSSTETARRGKVEGRDLLPSLPGPRPGTQP